MNNDVTNRISHTEKIVPRILMKNGNAKGVIRGDKYFTMITFGEILGSGEVTRLRISLVASYTKFIIRAGTINFGPI